MKKFILYISLLLSCVYARGQQAFTNSGNLQIHTGGSLSGFGAFTNSSGAALTDNGSLYVRGSLTNNQSSMAAGSGTLYLNGTVAQAVGGSQPFRTNNLVTDNTAGITLNTNLSVAGIHTYTNGLIATSATPNYLVYEAGSSHTGTTDSRHVTGWVKKYGTTAFTFPVGDAAYLRTVAISSLSGTAEFNCRYYTPTQNIYNLTGPVVKVKQNEYWQIDKIAGGTATVTLTWEHAKVPMNNVLLPHILASRYSAGTWIDGGGATTATGTTITTGSVTSNALTTFGSITFGYTTMPVPLKLISFTAERKTGASLLHWVTDNEQQVGHFEVERSYDGTTFSAIGHVSARNSGSQEHYFFDDRSALKGFAYYRIRSIDTDGKTSYTRIAVVSEADLASHSFVVLNPVRTAITVLNKTGHEGLFDYRLFHSTGALVARGSVNMSSNGGTLIALPFQTAAGVYILEMSNDKTQFRQKIVVEK